MRILSLFAVLGAAHALWPRPQHSAAGSTPLLLSPSFTITFSSSLPHPPQDLRDAATRTHAQLFGDKLGRLVPDRGASDVPRLAHAPALAQLELALVPGAPAAQSISAEATKPLGSRVEGCTLRVPTSGHATITANSTLGLLRGLTTFSQMWWTADGKVYLLDAPVEVNDAPAYPYRGFMLDTSRNFFPVADIKRTLDTMSWVKMSQLHWHITDAQSFPLVIPSHPEVSKAGAYSADEVYSPVDVADIVAYAAARGIDVLPEIDTPGHTTAIGLSHPEHVACFDAAPWSTYANEPPAGQLRLVPATASFTSGLLSAVAKLFPSTLFSTGGDEVNLPCYDADVPTQAYLNASGKTVEQALADFVLDVHKGIHSVGKSAVVWEEMVLDHDIPVANDTVVMVWISSTSAQAVAAKGYDLVHAPSDYFYLDCGQGEWIGNTSDATSWCDPFKGWQRAYTFDPRANLTAAEARRVRGGQQLLWTEQSDPANLDPQVWPRAAVSAELFWSGPGTTTNVTEALPRLHELRFRMVARGTQAIALQPKWCALRPGKCELNA